MIGIDNIIEKKRSLFKKNEFNKILLQTCRYVVTGSFMFPWFSVTYFVFERYVLCSVNIYIYIRYLIYFTFHI